MYIGDKSVYRTNVTEPWRKGRQYERVKKMRLLQFLTPRPLVSILLRSSSLCVLLPGCQLCIYIYMLKLDPLHLAGRSYPRPTLLAQATQNTTEMLAAKQQIANYHSTPFHPSFRTRQYEHQFAVFINSALTKTLFIGT